MFLYIDHNHMKYLYNIVAVSFIGGGNRSIRKNHRPAANQMTMM
jgi:hypothetical protein